MLSTHDAQLINYLSHIIVKWNRRWIDWLDESCFRSCVKFLIVVRIDVTSSDIARSRNGSDCLYTIVVCRLSSLWPPLSKSLAFVDLCHQFASSFQKILYLPFSRRLPSSQFHHVVRWLIYFSNRTMSVGAENAPVDWRVPRSKHAVTSLVFFFADSRVVIWKGHYRGRSSQGFDAHVPFGNNCRRTAVSHPYGSSEIRRLRVRLFMVSNELVRIIEWNGGTPIKMVLHREWGDLKRSSL